MFTDPLALNTTANLAIADRDAGASTEDWVCTGRGDSKSTYRYKISESTWIDLTVAHQYGNRRRFTVRFDEHGVVANPLDTSVNIIKTGSLYIVCDAPLAFDPTYLAVMEAALAHFVLPVSDGPNFFDRVVAGET